MSSSKVAVRQDMPPKGGYAPIHWKRYAPKRTIPGYFIFCAYAGAACYCYYKSWLLRFEYRVHNEAHRFHIQRNMYPFLWAEDDRRRVRAKKQNEEDIKLVMGGDGWDPYRRAFAQEDVWCPWSGREMRVLLTDEERVALGGKPSRYSVNNLWSNYNWQQDHMHDISVQLIPEVDSNHNVFNLEMTEDQI